MRCNAPSLRTELGRLSKAVPAMSAPRPSDTTGPSPTLASAASRQDPSPRPKAALSQDDAPATAVSWIVAGLLGFSGVLLTREGLYRRRLGAAVRAVQARGEAVPPNVMRRMGGSGRSGLLIAAGLGVLKLLRFALMSQRRLCRRQWRRSRGRWPTSTSQRDPIDAIDGPQASTTDRQIERPPRMQR